MDQKSEQLKGLLNALPTNEAVSLARKLETQRALGQETLPAEAVLSFLRPQLRRVRPQRVPTLCRLACAGFEDFLVDRVDDPRLPGLIPRSAIAPWWQALERMAPQELRIFSEEFARLVGASDWPALDRLGERVRNAARGWTDAVMAAFQSRKLADSVTRKHLGDIGLQADFAEIARILAIAEPLRKALDAVLAVAVRSGQTQGRRILDFTADAVTAAKQQYLHVAEVAGFDSRYFALGLMNRLERPWYVLRLGRALSWKPTDALLHDTELGIIGQRLIHDIEVLAREIEGLMPSRRGRGPQAVDYGRLHQAMSRYIENSEGMLSEFGFRRDSDWGEQILETRAALSRTLGQDRLALVAEAPLALLPQRRGVSARGLASDDPDLETAPTPEVIEQGLRAARLLVLLMQKGGRHGLSSPARITIDELGIEINNRAAKLYDELAQHPTHEAAAAQLAAIIKVAEVLFEDGRAAVMTRRLVNMQRSSAPV
ncbi:MAG TPA: hypothetical protein VN823_11885 [Stellaceae bacterium]|nr:hypothetical protein [Stellaceae bacterium]